MPSGERLTWGDWTTHLGSKRQLRTAHVQGQLVYRQWDGPHGPVSNRQNRWLTENERRELFASTPRTPDSQNVLGRVIEGGTAARDGPPNRRPSIDPSVQSYRIVSGNVLPHHFANTGRQQSYTDAPGPAGISAGGPSNGQSPTVKHGGPARASGEQIQSSGDDFSPRLEIPLNCHASHGEDNTSNRHAQEFNPSRTPQPSREPGAPVTRQFSRERIDPLVRQPSHGTGTSSEQRIPSKSHLPSGRHDFDSMAGENVVSRSDVEAELRDQSQRRGTQHYRGNDSGPQDSSDHLVSTTAMESTQRSLLSTTMASNNRLIPREATRQETRGAKTYYYDRNGILINSAPNASYRNLGETGTVGRLSGQNSSPSLEIGASTKERLPHDDFQPPAIVQSDRQDSRYPSKTESRHRPETGSRNQPKTESGYQQSAEPRHQLETRSTSLPAVSGAVRDTEREIERHKGTLITSNIKNYRQSPVIQGRGSTKRYGKLPEKSMSPKTWLGSSERSIEEQQEEDDHDDGNGANEYHDEAHQDNSSRRKSLVTTSPHASGSVQGRNIAGRQGSSKHRGSKTSSKGQQRTGSPTQPRLDSRYEPQQPSSQHSYRDFITLTRDLQPIFEKEVTTTRIGGDGVGDKEQLNPRYKVRNPSHLFFTTGRVFAMLWHESDRSRQNHTDISDPDYRTPGSYGQQIYTTVRRMAVVKESHGHCQCIPIVTYRGQGCKKSGLSKDDVEGHTVVYMAGSDPFAHPQEVSRGMHKKAIEVKPSTPDQRLLPMSRLNFGKTYTVEHNVKVMDVGTIEGDSHRHLVTYFWNTFCPPPGHGSAS